MTRIRQLTLAAAASLMVAGLALAEPAKVSPPPPGEPVDYALPAKTRFTLANGIPVTLVPFGEVPKLSIVVRVRTGNIDEGDRTWLADLAGVLMKEGTENFTGPEISRRAASLGGSIDVGVGLETSSVSMSALSEKSADAVGLVAEVLRRPVFPASELDRVRNDFLRNLSIAKSQPDGLAREAFYARAYAGHPFARIYPTQEQLLSYTIDDVRAFYVGNFGAKRTSIYVAGRFDADEVRRAIEENFSDWEAGPEPTIAPPSPTREASLQVIDRPGAPQSTVLAGLPVPDVSDPGYMKLTVMNTLLGGGSVSRLFENLREDKGWTYGASTSLGGHYRSGLWTFSVDVTTPATGPALSEFFSEVRRLQAEPPGTEELDRIKGYRGGTFVLANASRGGIIGTLASMDFHGLDDTYLTGYLERLEAVTPGDVSEAARLIRPEEMTVVVVGDRSVIDEQLAGVAELETPEAE